MAKRRPKTQRYPKYTWRPVVELTWKVIRLNEDGSESYYRRYKSEKAAKKMAAIMNKAAHEGREWVELAVTLISALARVKHASPKASLSMLSLDRRNAFTELKSSCFCHK